MRLTGAFDVDAAAVAALVDAALWTRLARCCSCSHREALSTMKIRCRAHQEAKRPMRETRAAGGLTGWAGRRERSWVRSSKRCETKACRGPTSVFSSVFVSPRCGHAARRNQVARWAEAMEMRRETNPWPARSLQCSRGRPGRWEAEARPEMTPTTCNSVPALPCTPSVGRSGCRMPVWRRSSDKRMKEDGAARSSRRLRRTARRQLSYKRASVPPPPSPFSLAFFLALSPRPSSLFLYLV